MAVMGVPRFSEVESGNGVLKIYAHYEAARHGRPGARIQAENDAFCLCTPEGRRRLAETLAVPLADPSKTCTDSRKLRRTLADTLAWKDQGPTRAPGSGTIRRITKYRGNRVTIDGVASYSELCNEMPGVSKTLRARTTECGKPVTGSTEGVWRCRKSTLRPHKASPIFHRR